MSLAPPWTAETAHKKVKAAQNLWNTKDADKVVNAYTSDTIWRNRDVFLRGTEQVRAFLKQKWVKEQHYRLKKEIFAFSDDKIAVQFWYEYCPDPQSESTKWRRCYGIEHWTFEPSGKMRKRQMSGNDVDITHDQRWFKDGMTEDDIDRLQLSEEHH